MANTSITPPPSEGSNVNYDNTTSGLTATNTQSAIDELVINVNTKTPENPTFTEASTRTNITSGESFSTILGKIKKFFSDLKTVAFSGSYNDLSNTPTIPSKTSQLTNDSGYITSSANITGTSANVTGTVAIANGGTGATSRLNAAKNLTNENVGTAVTHVIGLTNSWGKFGYVTLANLKSALSLNNVNNTADANKSVNYATTSGGVTGVGGFSTAYTFNQNANDLVTPGLYAVATGWTNLPPGSNQSWATMLVIGTAPSTPVSQTYFDSWGAIWTRSNINNTWESWQRQYRIHNLTDTGGSSTGGSGTWAVTSRTTWQEIHGTVSGNIISVMACPAGRYDAEGKGGTFQYYTTWSGTTWYVYYKNTVDYSADGINVWVLW